MEMIGRGTTKRRPAPAGATGSSPGPDEAGEASPPLAVRRWRLFPKYALLVIALVGGMLLAASALNLYFSWRETRAQLVALQVEKAQSAAGRIAQYVQGIEEHIGWTALPALDAGGANAIEGRRIEYLKLLRQVPAITEAAWIDATGREQLRVSRLAMDTSSAGGDASREPRFLVARTGKTWYGPVHFRKETEPYMTIARPAGSAGGVTAAEVNLKFVWDVVSRIRVGAKGLAYVIDSSGTLIAHPDISLVLRKIDLRELPQVRGLGRDAGAGEPAAIDVSGRPVFSAHAAIPTLGWTVFVEAPRDEALAPLRASIERLALLFAAGLALSILASFFLARALVRPIRVLQEGAARIGSGRLDQRIRVKTGDELEGLAEQFNRMAEQLRESYAGLERKVEQRTAELSEALEYQTAISQVLRVISESPADVAPVFEAILDSAARLFGSPMAAVYRYDGRLVHLVAMRNWPSEAIAMARRLYPSPPDDALMAGRLIIEGRALGIEDALADPTYKQAFAVAGGWRRVVGAPMLKEGAPIGAILVSWRDPGPTPQRQVDLLETFADQAVIAIENVRLVNETHEALEQQTASADILKVISQSPTDVQPVFDAIAGRAMILCGAIIGAVARFDGELVHLLAFQGTSPGAAETMRASYPMSLDGEATLVRAIRERAPVQVPDVLADPSYGIKHAASAAGYRANMAVPMLREGHVVGSIGVCREAPGAFPDRLVRLLQSFADQAVIAIENVRLFNETKEALERQTATAEILKVISESPTEVQPVLDALAERAVQLCRAEGSRVWLREGEALRAMTGYRLADGSEAGRDERLPLAPTSIVARAFLERRIVHEDDVAALPADGYPATLAMQQRHGFHTMLAVPMLREGEPIGVIGLPRRQIKPFTPVEIELVQTFADQAVIAIENVRLFNETKEALEQQTATAGILQVISSSVADTRPVFQAILESCERLFGGMHMGITLVGEDGWVRLAAQHGKASTDELERTFPVPLSMESASGSSILTGRVMHYPDIGAPDVPVYAKRSSRAVDTRSLIMAPLLWEGRGIGSIFVGRSAVGPFSDKDIALLKTFADQAVIAIQNARLFNETKDALEQQTATSEVLKAISRTTFDLEPLLATLIDSAGRLCKADKGFVYLREGETYRMRVSYQADPEPIELPPLRAQHGTLVGRTALTREMVHIEDALNDPSYTWKEAQSRLGFRTMLGVPMLREGEPVGVLAMWRSEVRAFSERDIRVAATFADQAVIALENVRLLTETKDALERQTATAEVLQVISASVADTQPVFEKILKSCQHLFESSEQGVLLAGDDGLVHLGAHRGTARERLERVFPQPIHDDGPVATAMRERRVLHFPDVLHGVDVPAIVRGVAQRIAIGNYSQVMAPMLWEGRGVGVLYVTRQPPSPFGDKELDLLKTFADQAAIAIQNARLFREIEDKSRQLEQANKHKSEFLANMSHELRTPLNAIIGFSEVLAEQMFGDVNDKQLEYLRDIHSSGHHLLSLINDILDLSKIEAGRMELDLTCFDLGLLLDNAMTLVRERAGRHGLTLVLDVADDVEDWVADARKVKQVVINLLSNAVKFTPPGGRVMLRARRENGAVEIAVIDTGVGIAPDQQALVFEEFRQASGDYLRKGEGTGLGLSLAKRFVELHGGAIRVESAAGHGSTFAFTLPERVLQAALD